MSVREIKEAMEKGNVCLGIKQAIKNSKNLKNVFIARDAREDVVEKLEAAGIEFSVLKSKEDISRELNLDFESEVFSILSETKKSKKK